MKKKILFIMPSVGRKKDQPYVKSWNMQPLAIAVLSALTPDRYFEKHFVDDRMEKIPYDMQVDAVMITVETYSAKRTYQIAREFRKKQIPVILGGFHVTLLPEEAMQHADAIVIGEAEGCWQELLEDLSAKRLKKHYKADTVFGTKPFLPDLNIYKDKRYLNLSMLETSRGCRYNCEFCSISSFFNHKCYFRSIEDVIHQIKSTGKKKWFFVDDNIGSDPERLEQLLKALIPLKIIWTGQISIEITRYPKLLELMNKSGCIGVLIGFESINPDNVSQMGKKINTVGDYEKAVKNMRKYGMCIYGTFVFGYDEDTVDTFTETLRFAKQSKMFFAAFNHLVPFPGTALYKRLEEENRLLYDKWWLDDNYKFGDVAFKPKNFSASELTELCLIHRNKFYTVSSIFRRGFDFKGNCNSLFMTALFYIQNFRAKKDVALRQELPMGFEE
ncbi:MAG: B12-binding domain-containing radical SAM protein [Bacteroidota bacterium]